MVLVLPTKRSAVFRSAELISAIPRFDREADRWLGTAELGRSAAVDSMHGAV